jgi:hypothetical protein
MDRPEYCCGPPVAQQTISVTRYLNPAGDTLWCASSTRGVSIQYWINHDPVDQVIDYRSNVINASKPIIECGFFLNLHGIPPFLNRLMTVRKVPFNLKPLMHQDDPILCLD